MNQGVQGGGVGKVLAKTDLLDYMKFDGSEYDKLIF